MAVLALAGAVAVTGTAVGAQGKDSASGPSGASDAPGATASGVAGYDVTAYDVTIDYKPDGKKLHAVTVINAKAKSALNSLTLQLDGPQVRSVEVDSKKAQFATKGEKDFTVEPAKTIPKGAAFRVRVAYDGTPGPGWMPTESGGASAMIGNAGAWFPAHEDAHDKADFRLTATVPKGWAVVSIGRETPPSGPSDTTFRWSEPAVDPAQVAVTIDRLAIDRSELADGTPVVNAYAPGLRESTKPLADRLPEIIDFLSDKFGPYPYSSAGNVFVNVNDDGPGTAPATRPVYLGAGNAEFMNLDEVVHEQAHEWYANSVTLAADEDSCLSECIASYSTWLWDEAKDGVDLDSRYREQVEEHKDDASWWQSLYTPGRPAGMSIYTKGPLALHALRHLIGDAAFNRTIKEFPQKQRGTYARWTDFESFAGKSSGQDLTAFFKAWFHDEGIPADEYLWPGELRP